MATPDCAARFSQERLLEPLGCILSAAFKAQDYDTPHPHLPGCAQLNRSPANLERFNYCIQWSLAQKSEDGWRLVCCRQLYGSTFNGASLRRVRMAWRCRRKALLKLGVVLRAGHPLWLYGAQRTMACRA